MLVDEKIMSLVGFAILVVLFLVICISGGTVIYFTGHFTSILREDKDEEKDQKNNKQRRYLILLIGAIIFYGLVSLALLISFYKVTNFFW